MCSRTFSSKFKNNVWSRSCLEARDAEDTHQTESPPWVRPSLQGCLEDDTADNSSLDDGRQIAPSDQLRREVPHHKQRNKVVLVFFACFMGFTPQLRAL